MRMLRAGALALALATWPACDAARHPRTDPLEGAFAAQDLSLRATEGRQLFLARCAPCHGPEGRGDGQNAYNLDPPPPDFAESLSQTAPEVVRTIVVHGTAAAGRSPLCPPRGAALDEAQVEALVAFVTTLGQGWTESGERADGP